MPQISELKKLAMQMRLGGASIGEIERNLNIPRSTLSGWLKGITLTKSQKLRLEKKMRAALVKSRKKAILWHNHQKATRLATAEAEADKVLGKINGKNKELLELALAMLYLGEGAKTATTSMGNSDPLILRFYVDSMEKIYNFSRSKAKCELHLRADQDQKNIINFWSNELKIPAENFIFTKDKRTTKSKTFDNYKGVCSVRFSGIAIQRRLVFLARKFCNIISGTND